MNLHISKGWQKSTEDRLAKAGPGGRRMNNRVCLFVLSLHVSWLGKKCGFLYWQKEKTVVSLLVMTNAKQQSFYA